MKKSSQVILYLTVISIGLIAAIPITFRYKLANGLFSRTNAVDDLQRIERKFMGIKIVKIKGVSCELISADSLHLEVENNGSDISVMQQSGDTLFVTSSTPGFRVRIFAGDLKLVAEQCEILIRGSLDQVQPPSYCIDMNRCRITSKAISSDHRIKQHIGNMSIKGNGTSSIALAGSVRLEKLQLYDMRSIELDQTIQTHELDIEYSTPVRVKSYSNKGAVKVQVEGL